MTAEPEPSWLALDPAQQAGKKLTMTEDTPLAAPLTSDPGLASADARLQPTGHAVIAGYCKHLTTQPGVYRMIDVAGDVIYVGKARSLKARVSNYARPGQHTTRIARMIAATAAMEFVTVSTEAEALLLEANLIKRFRPRYNVLLRDDKSFPYILITRDTRAPMLTKHRGARTSKGDYFGPFASAGAVSRTINVLQRAFLLRTCSDSMFETVTRPCILHQIKRCSAPCTNEIAPADYLELVDEAVRFLRGESQLVREQLKSAMIEAADRLEYEQAAMIRNRLTALAHVTADQAINPEGVEEADVFAAYQEGGQTCIQVFFFRMGQNWGNRAYYPRADRSLTVEEVLDPFLAQFYLQKPVPRLILLSHEVANRDVLEDALSLKAERRVEIRVPERGVKTGLVAHAMQNAREALGRKLAETSSQSRLLEGVAERFGLDRVPRRVEVYDNSHIMGTNAVGAMIVAGRDGFVKNQYRKFNIKSDSLTPGDDYAMMREVLTRRFKKLAGGAVHSPPPPAGSGETGGADVEAEDDPPAGMAEFPERPDLVLIDGGPGQLSVARAVFADLGITDIALVGVAKGPDRDAGREHFHIPGRSKSLMLEPRDPVLYFLQRLRDEAHRFVIGTHRAKRAKTLIANPLDEIEGIGPTRKRALLSHFGSAKGVSRAGIEDLKAVSGISAEMAQKVYDFFNEQKS
jgi:excinuclease ABC subunit C